MLSVLIASNPLMHVGMSQTERLFLCGLMAALASFENFMPAASVAAANG